MRPEVKTTSDSDLESVFSIEEPKLSGKQPRQKKYVCSFTGCGQTFRRMVHLDRHEYKHTGVRKHVCFHDGCSKSYTIITHLKRHIKVFHEKVKKQLKNTRCSFDFCDKMFCSVYSMERHIREVHENPKIYKCTHCDEKFTQKLKLRRHEIKHTGVFPYNCSECSKGFLHEHFLQRHICKSYKCEQCQTTFTKWSQLIAHRKAIHHKTIHKCEECNKEYTTKCQLTEHKRTHDEDREVFVCPEEGCTKFYAYKSNLTQHIRSAHEGRKFPCTVEGCEVVLSFKSTLDNHLKVIHSGKKNKRKQPKKPRLKRKDAGKAQKSTLCKLSGVVLGRRVDKMILGGSAEIEVTLPAIKEEIQNGATGTDDDDAAEGQFVVLTVKSV